MSRISSLELVDHPALDVLRVTAVLACRKLVHPRLEAVLERETFCVYRRTGVPPRARVVTSTITTAGLAGPIEVLAARLSDPARQTVLPADAPEWNCAGDASKGTVEIDDVGSGRVILKTHDTPRGWLVLADAWYPGWRATVDGREARIVDVDHALRGVALDAGEHEIVFTYAPASLRLGAWISALALVILIARHWRARALVAVS